MCLAGLMAALKVAEKVEWRAEHSVRLRVDERAAQMADMMELSTADK